MARWTRVCRLKDIARPGSHAVSRDYARDVAVFRTAGDRLFALFDRCPHRGAPLSRGVVHEGHVVCPLHSTRVDLESGHAVPPDKGCVKTFAVKIEKGIVYVDLQLEGTGASAALARADPVISAGCDGRAE